MRTADKNWSAHGEILDGELKTATKEPTELHILNKKHHLEGVFHRHFKDKFQISFHFKDIFAQENPLSDFTNQFESNYLKLFDHFQSLALIKLRF